MDSRPNLNPGEPLVLPSNLQGWYNGKTTITLPDGRQYIPCNQCYLKYNPDAFTGQVLTEANRTLASRRSRGIWHHVLYGHGR